MRTFILLLLSLAVFYPPSFLWAEEMVFESPISATEAVMDAHAKVEFGLASLEQAEDGSYVITYELTATQGIPVGSSLSLSLSRHNKETGQLIKEYEEVIAGSVPFMAEGTVVSGSAPLFPPLNLDGEFVATLALYGVAGNLVSLTSLGEITLTNPPESVPVTVTCRAVTASGGVGKSLRDFREIAPEEGFEVVCPVINNSVEETLTVSASLVLRNRSIAGGQLYGQEAPEQMVASGEAGELRFSVPAIAKGTVVFGEVLVHTPRIMRIPFRYRIADEPQYIAAVTQRPADNSLLVTWQATTSNPLTLVAEFVGKDFTLCTEARAYASADGTRPNAAAVSLPDLAACEQPLVLLKLLAADGSLVDMVQSRLAVSDPGAATPAFEISPAQLLQYLLVLIGLLGLGAGIFYLLKKRSNHIVASLFILGTVFLAGVSEVEAGSANGLLVPMPPSYPLDLDREIQYFMGTNKETYAPGETIVINVSVFYGDYVQGTPCFTVWVGSNPSTCVGGGHFAQLQAYATAPLSSGNYTIMVGVGASPGYNGNAPSLSYSVSAPVPTQCTYSGPLSWGAGCGTTVGPTSANAGGTVGVTNTNGGFTGSATYRCDNPATNAWSLQSQSCSPIPTQCTFAGYVSWPGGCGATVGLTAANAGGTVGVTNTNAGLTGSATYRCDNPASNSWSLIGNSCAPVPTPQCTISGTVNWGGGCSANTYVTRTVGNSVTVFNTNASYNGNITYRCDAQDVWTITGSSCVFIPPTPPPPTPTGVSASTDPGCGSGTNYISWNPSPGATSYNLSFGSVIYSVSSPYAHYGLLPSTVYNYAVQAVGPGGNSAWSAPVAVMTAGACAAVPPTQPSGPVTVTPAATCGGGIQIAWGAGTGATSYEISRNGGTTWTNVGNVLSYTDTGTSSTSYTYQVRSRNAAGVSASVSGTGMSSAACPPPPVPPTQPSGPVTVTAAATCGGSIDISWGAGAGATSYEISNNGGATWTNVGNVLTYTDTVSPATSYTYQVRSRNAAGVSASVSGTGMSSSACPPPSAPTGPVSVGPGIACGGSIDIAWGAGTGATSYEISRNGGTTWTNVGNVLSYTDTGTSSTSYTYQVRSRNALGVSAAVSGTGTSSVACAVPPTQPSGPVTVTAAATCGGSIDISWGAGTGATSYEISNNGGATWTNVGNVLTYTDTVSPATSYTYQVRSRNAAGVSASVSGTGMSSAACPVGVLQINNFSVPSFVLPGQSYNVTWNTSGSQICWIEARDFSTSDPVPLLSLNPAGPTGSMSHSLPHLGVTAVNYVLRCSDTFNYQLTGIGNVVSESRFVSLTNSSLTTPMCTIPENANSCTANVTWLLLAGNNPFNIRNDTTGVVIGSTNSGSASTNFVYATNTLIASAQGIPDEVRDVFIDCDTDLFYNNILSRCSKGIIITPAPPVVWVRAGRSAEIEFSIEANYPVRCDLEGLGGGASGPTVHNHAASAVPATYSSQTAVLQSAQVVEIICEEASGTLPASRKVTEVRVNVLPETQEI